MNENFDAARLTLLLSQLRLPATKQIWSAFAERSDKEGWPAARLLTAIAENELAERDWRRIERHLAEAKLLPGKTLDNFDFNFVPMVSKALVAALCAGDEWLRSGANVLLLGPPGGGKSHLSSAIGLALQEKGSSGARPVVRSAPVSSSKPPRRSPAWWPCSCRLRRFADQQLVVDGQIAHLDLAADIDAARSDRQLGGLGVALPRIARGSTRPVLVAHAQARRQARDAQRRRALDTASPIRHIKTRPYTPNTNGKAERFVQTSLREWAYARPYLSSAQRQAALQPFLHRYNWHRPHCALNRQPPVNRILAVSNLLELDN